MSNLCEELHAEGLDRAVAEQVASACHSREEALELARLIQQDSGQSSQKGGWREWFSVKEQRYYYAHGETGASNGWEPPLLFSFRDWVLDAEIYGIPLSQARRCFDAAQSMLSAQPFLGGGKQTMAQQSITLLVKCIGNVVDCDNSIDRYRTLRTDNPKVASSIVGVPGALEVLKAAGFIVDPVAHTIHFPPDRPLHSARVVLARLRRLSESKGHSGDATTNNDLQDGSASGGGNPQASPFAGQPGFRYQTHIYQCGCCERPIPDGSERLWTRQHSSPRGEFRYECMSCESFNLCETCWDRLAEAPGMHDTSHAFSAHHPVLTRHNNNSDASDTNPWGVRRGDGAARARAHNRLMERTGQQYF